MTPSFERLLAKCKTNKQRLNLIALDKMLSSHPLPTAKSDDFIRVHHYFVKDHLRAKTVKSKPHLRLVVGGSKRSRY